jgi:hypothetical protein
MWKGEGEGEWARKRFQEYIPKSKKPILTEEVS